MKTIFDSPIFATHGGGYAKKINGGHEFVVSPPDFPDINVGDKVPLEWNLIPVGEYSEKLGAYVL